MREIVARIDDSGRTKVKIVTDPSSRRFITKREFSLALRAIKLAYRRAIKEHRRKLIKKEVIKELKNEFREQNWDGRESESKNNSIAESGNESPGGAQEPTKPKGIISFGTRG